MSSQQNSSIQNGGQNGALAAEPAGALRAEIDALATRAMIASSDADSVAGLLAGLSEISRQAAAAGFAAIPPEVAKLQQEMGIQGSLNPLLSGIGQLQKLLEDSPEAAVEVAPSAGFSIAADPELIAQIVERKVLSVLSGSALLEGFVSEVLDSGREAIAAAKTLLSRISRCTPDEATRLTVDAIATQRVSAEAQERMTAFLRKSAVS